MRLDVAGRSDAGLVRAQNEDRFAINFAPDGTSVLCVVADGMGGHASGELAASLAVEQVVAVTSGGADLAAAVSAANSTIHQRAADADVHRGMGTTIVCAVVAGDGVRYAHAGDSRIYLVRDGTALQLTADHSWVAEEVRAGRLTPEEARRSSARNLVTRALGVQPEVRVDEGTRELQPDDALVMCTDGIYNLVDDVELAAACRVAADEGCARLIQLANERGGPDNATAVIVRVLNEHVGVLSRSSTRPLPDLGDPTLPSAPPPDVATSRPARASSPTQRTATWSRAAVFMAVVLAIIVVGVLSALLVTHLP